MQLTATQRMPVRFGTSMSPELSRKFREAQTQIANALTQVGYGVTRDADAFFNNRTPEKVLVSSRSFGINPMPALYVCIRPASPQTEAAEVAQLAATLQQVANAGSDLQQVTPTSYQGTLSDFMAEVRSV